MVEQVDERAADSLTDVNFRVIAVAARAVNADNAVAERDVVAVDRVCNVFISKFVDLDAAAQRSLIAFESDASICIGEGDNFIRAALAHVKDNVAACAHEDRICARAANDVGLVADRSFLVNNNNVAAVAKGDVFLTAANGLDMREVAAFNRVEDDRLAAVVHVDNFRIIVAAQVNDLRARDGVVDVDCQREIKIRFRRDVSRRSTADAEDKVGVGFGERSVGAGVVFVGSAHAARTANLIQSSIVGQTGTSLDLVERSLRTYKNVVRVVDVSSRSVVVADDDVASLRSEGSRVGVDVVGARLRDFDASFVVEVENSANAVLVRANDKNSVVVVVESVLVAVNRDVDRFINRRARERVSRNLDRCIVESTGDCRAVSDSLNCSQVAAVAAERDRRCAEVVNCDVVAVNRDRNVAVLVNHVAVKVRDVSELALASRREVEAVFIAEFEFFFTDEEGAVFVCRNREARNVDRRVARDTVRANGLAVFDDDAVGFAVVSFGDVDVRSVDSDRTFSDNRAVDHAADTAVDRACADNRVRIDRQDDVVAVASEGHLLTGHVRRVDVERSNNRVELELAGFKSVDARDRCACTFSHPEFCDLVVSGIHREALTAREVEGAVLVSLDSRRTTGMIDDNSTAARVADFSDLGDSVAKLFVPIAVFVVPTIKVALAVDLHCTFVVLDIEFDVVYGQFVKFVTLDPTTCTNAADFNNACSAGCHEANVGVAAGRKGLS